MHDEVGSNCNRTCALVLSKLLKQIRLVVYDTDPKTDGIFDDVLVFLRDLLLLEDTAHQLNNLMLQLVEIER
jgi:hypothetical protein